MHYTISLLCIFFGALFLSCKKQVTANDPAAEPDALATQSVQGIGPHRTIAVVSDIHYTDPSLLLNDAVNGTSFQATCRKIRNCYNTVHRFFNR